MSKDCPGFDYQQRCQAGDDKIPKKIKNPGLYFVQQMTFDLGTGGLVISWILGGSKDKIRS